jgi:hypothetical protein
MGDMAEDFRALRGHQRKRKAAEMPAKIEAILALKQAGYSVRVMSDGWHYRVNNRIDLYPVRQRWHDIRRNVRGWYDDPAALVTRLLTSPAKG